jgi:hypothetical protein
MVTAKRQWIQLIYFACFLLAVLLLPYRAEAQEGQVIFGIKIKAGGRFDNVRMCVASSRGSKGGPAADVTFYTEVGLTDDMSISIDLPVFRPVLFAAAFGMLQFEPDVSLLFRAKRGDKADFIVGPTLGLSLHYGPDYNSERAKGKRSPSFFAMGPRIGAYLAADFTRPNETMNFQLGVQPYVTPLFGINDPDAHKGVVLGGSIDSLFRFNPNNY